MRSPEDLRRAFDAASSEPVDTDRILAGIRTRIAARRARRRRATILSVAAATVLLAITPFVVSSLDDEQQPDGGSVASSPSATEGETLDAPALRPTQFAFAVGERPPDYTMEYATTGPGVQSLHLSVLDLVEPNRTLDVELFDPALSGLPAPDPTGEVLTVDSPTAGPIDVQVIGAPTGEHEQSFGVGWQTGNGLWLTVTSDGPADLARQEVLAVAAQVDLGGSYPLRFPFQVGYLPDGFEVAGTSGGSDLEGGSTTLEFVDSSTQLTQYEPAMSIQAVNAPGVPEDAVPNTTVGPYQGQLVEDASYGLYLSLYDVGGFLINIGVREEYRDRIDEAQMRRIAESIVVLPGAAQDFSVWTDQPVS